jgi:hypothetical protein
MLATTTTASGFCACDPISVDNAAGNSLVLHGWPASPVT